MADKYLCRACSKPVAATKNHRYRSHTGGDGGSCANSSEPIPEGLEPESEDPGVPKEGADFAQCPHCTRNVKLTRLGYYEPHETTLRGGESCPNGGVRFRATEDLSLPGEGIPAEVGVLPEPARSNLLRQPAGSALDASSGAFTEASSPELTPTSEPSPESATEAVSTGPFRLGESFSTTVLQPFSPFLQPPPYEGSEKAEPMGDLAKELATRIKETFYSYSNRKSVDNRSAQTTLGPSEIGSPCDRRLAMALMGIPAVNPGGDGWASFVGTCGHVGMGEVYTFADAGTGRYAVELPVRLGSDFVPRGTTDLLDRRDGTIIDWKFMGAYSLKKFKLEGPSDTYRIQAQTYGLGATLAGEKVRNVAIVGLPRAGSSLDEMHVWTEPFDKKIGLAALARVEGIASKIETHDTENSMKIAQAFPTDSDSCRYCPFHLKNDREMIRGCPGS